MLKASRRPLATRQRSLRFRPQNRTGTSSSNTSMGLDFELDEKNGDQADEIEKSSYVSLSRQNSKVHDTRSASSLDFGEHCSPSITKLPKNSREGKEVNLIMSDGEPEDYRRGQGSKRRLPDSEALGSKLKEELCKYKQELKDYNESTKDLEEKYMKINYELCEMQQKHDQFVSSRKQAHQVDLGSEPDPDGFYSSASSVASQTT
ncbi:GD23239 [Drosophila simulans]|nr:GD23239 [Drosophila simulans]